MPRIISVHEYTLKPQIDVSQFEMAIQDAKNQGLFNLPGLVEYSFVKGIRGARQDQYAAIWVYESEEAWANLWGSVGQPHNKDEYPQTWKIWEDEVLAPFIIQDPDKIVFTSYREV